MAEAKTTWGAGEYALMAQALEPVSAQLVDAAQVSAGDRVIDVATGTGNAALHACSRGASVIGVDFEPTLLAQARDRAEAADLEIDFVSGEAEALPVADGAADVVLSAFGVMYALDHDAAARELVRVLSRSGRIAIAAWVPGSVMPAMGAVVARYLPPLPATSAPPARWGDPEALETLLAGAGAILQTTRSDRLLVPFANAQTAADFLIRTAGHIVSEREPLSASGQWHSLHHDVVAFAEQAGEPKLDELVLTFDYLIAIARPA